eukprot:CAMPEP_0174380904 /NCGR_PEP_ID=MMETSP0811_2-20130205/123665_1 /TAXON_ID=73025 ORGANISM="Eutreptiella gymnastica-like, Strain CCMP1594" /NCGR_SAMPLE_ID=MMETSP0811_2 /ASSEMBLY_ACC=CAM_ASM_000667 /LENGTH=67 /DNA_ID=CAMNT_0015533887 /DNA_START=732 /DNA_END=931 /DNA_ORIENTATION=+
MGLGQGRVMCLRPGHGYCTGHSGSQAETGAQGADPLPPSSRALMPPRTALRPGSSGGLDPPYSLSRP